MGITLHGYCGMMQQETAAAARLTQRVNFPSSAAFELAGTVEPRETGGVNSQRLAFRGAATISRRTYVRGSKVIACAMLIVLSTSPLFAAEKKRPPAKREMLACRLGTEDRHARIAVVLVGGKMTEFAYYSKWKPRTCSVYVQRGKDSISKWSDNGHLTTVALAEGKGDFLIEHNKNGTYKLEFHGIDRERYCGMDGKINGFLVIKKNNAECELAGIMEEGTPLGQAYPRSNDEDVAAAKAPAA